MNGSLLWENCHITACSVWLGAQAVVCKVAASQSSERTYFPFSSSFLVMFCELLKTAAFFFFPPPPLSTLYSSSRFHGKEAGVILHYIPLITSNTSIHICRIFLSSEIHYDFCYICVNFQHLVTPVLDIFWLVFTYREFCS